MQLNKALQKRNIVFGLAYYNGEGVPVDEAIGFVWWLKTAEQGFARAQHLVGFAYYYGQGVPVDDALAAKWYSKAAETRTY